MSQSALGFSGRSKNPPSETGVEKNPKYSIPWVAEWHFCACSSILSYSTESSVISICRHMLGIFSICTIGMVLKKKGNLDQIGYCCNKILQFCTLCISVVQRRVLTAPARGLGG